LSITRREAAEEVPIGRFCVLDGPTVAQNLKLLPKREVESEDCDNLCCKIRRNTMRTVFTSSLISLILMACGGAKPANSPGSEGAPQTPKGEESSSVPQGGKPAPTDNENEFQLADSDSAEGAQGESESKITATETEAAMKFFVVDKNKGPLKGIVISMTAPDGKKYYTGETDGAGYAEVLVPNGQKYELVYLSLGRKEVTASVPVNNDKNQNIKLTLRYSRKDPPKTPGRESPAGFVLKGVNFDTGKATIRPESIPRMDSLLEFMTYKKSARIEISGHTDNVGRAQLNKDLSERRAQAVRDFLVKEGVDKTRIEAVGYGDEQPLATNATDEGRQTNRRIEAREL
jgi:outer membrane protein OmpA-like peptidoglycan-associated protein